MDKKKILSIMLTSFAIALMAVSLTLPWAEIDGELDVLGAKAEIHVDINAQGFAYEATSNTSGAGLGGGLGGGILGNGGRNVNGSGYYFEGLEGFGAIGGILFQAPNPVNYDIIPITGASGELAEIQVSLNRPGPLWWPVGIEEDYELSITAVEVDSGAAFTIEEVQFYLYTEYNDTKASSNTDDRLVPYDTIQPYDPVTVNMVFDSAEDSWSYTHSFTVSEFHAMEGENTGRFAIGVEVIYTAEDALGTITTTGNTHPGTYPPANAQIQISGGQTAKVVMLGLTFPLILITMALGVIGVALTFKEHAKTRHMMLVLGILALLSIVFFWMGTGAFPELLETPTIPISEWMSFNLMTLALPIIASILFFVGCFFEWEEEEEEMVSFEVEDAEEDVPEKGIEEQAPTTVQFVVSEETSMGETSEGASSEEPSSEEPEV